jgi:hypothetical protein
MSSLWQEWTATKGSEIEQSPLQARLAAKNFSLINQNTKSLLPLELPRICLARTLFYFQYKSPIKNGVVDQSRIADKSNHGRLEK